MKNMIRIIVLMLLIFPLSIHAMRHHSDEYSPASLVGLPTELQEKIALAIFASNVTFKDGMQSLARLGRANKQLYSQLTNATFLNCLKQLIALKMQRSQVQILLRNCIYLKKLSAVKLLVQLVGDVNFTEAAYTKEPLFNRTTLMCAVQTACVNIVKVIIDAKANLNAIDSSGDTALMLAVSWTFTDIVKTLIDAGADLDIVNAQGRTALEYAISANYKEEIKLLQDAVNKNN